MLRWVSKWHQYLEIIVITLDVIEIYEPLLMSWMRPSKCGHLCVLVGAMCNIYQKLWSYHYTHNSRSTQCWLAFRQGRFTSRSASGLFCVGPQERSCLKQVAFLNIRLEIRWSKQFTVCQPQVHYILWTVAVAKIKNWDKIRSDPVPREKTRQGRWCLSFLYWP